MLGIIKKAARRPDADPFASINLITLQQLSHLHSHSNPSNVPPPDASPLFVTHKTLKKVIKRFPRGPAGGTRGLTFEHLKTTLSGSRSARDHVLMLVNQIVIDNMLQMPPMLASRHVALQERKCGV
jgi:hypothetical protein